jgi:phage FluMu gp28-like protein
MRPEIYNDYFLGMDVGRRIDATALVLIGRDNSTELRYVLYVKELWRTQYEEQVKIAKKIAEKLGNKLKLVVVDSTGMGDPIYEMLSEMDIGGKPLGSLVYPMRFTNESKTQMMSYLLTLLERRQLKISPEYRRLINQMKMQTYKITSSRIIYSHPEGGRDTEAISYHDDILWAMNLALYGDFITPFSKGAGVKFTEETGKERVGVLNKVLDIIKGGGK